MEWAIASSTMAAATKNGPVVIKMSFVRAENSKLHSGRNESKLNVNVFIASKAESIIGGQFTPPSTPSELVERPAIKRMHANDCNPDKTSFKPFAHATNGGNDKYDDKMATAISSTIARVRTISSLDSGHFLHKKLSE